MIGGFCKFAAFIILITVIQQTAANQCYSCKGPAKGTFDNHFVESLKYFDYLPAEFKDCHIASDNLPKVNCKSNECRKTVMNPKNSVPFVVRYCGDKFLHPTAGGDMLMTETCKDDGDYRINCMCKGNLCNSGSSLMSYFVLIVFAIISIFCF